MKIKIQQHPCLKVFLLLAAIASLLVTTSHRAHAAEPEGLVSIENLLSEMIDRESVARFPSHNFRLKQASSYNRASKSPDEPKGWFNNKDHSGQMIRVEGEGEKKEWVLMDHVGPGAIVRSWMPWRDQLKPGSDTTIRVYLDGDDEPTLEGNAIGMFDGSGLIPYPFAHQSLRSAVSFFPIPYAKSCKITADSEPFFFQFTYRAYDEDTAVKTFNMDDFKAAKDQMETVGQMLLDPVVQQSDEPIQVSRGLQTGQEASLDLPAGEAAVREIKVSLESYSNPDVTRQVVLKIQFDGEETVWCPIGDFFGSGIGLNPVQGWYRTVDADGTMKCRWVMPYQTGGKVSLVNLGEQAVKAQLAVTTSSWSWDESSMYFHAGWRGQFPVPTRPYSDWNYVDLKGRGVYVGDTLTIMNPVKRWWGEGDEKIWVDGEDFPSIFGTGTEDYYAYSWGGRSTDFYEHPFHAQPRAVPSTTSSIARRRTKRTRKAIARKPAVDRWTPCHLVNHSNWIWKSGHGPIARWDTELACTGTALTRRRPIANPNRWKFLMFRHCPKPSSLQFGCDCVPSFLRHPRWFANSAAGQHSLGSINGGYAFDEVLITGINYNPLAPVDGSITSRQLEFIEVSNIDETQKYLNDWRIRREVDFNFADTQVLDSGASLLWLRSTRPTPC